MKGQQLPDHDRPGDAALHDRRARLPGRLTGVKVRIFLTVAALATLLYTIGAPFEHGG